MRLAVAGLIAAAAIGPFLPGITAPLTEWDDPYYVSRSHHIQRDGWEGLAGLWKVQTALDDAQVEFFPLRDTAYWLLWHSFGAQPLPYHLLSVLLHALCAVLIWRLVLRLGFSPWAALAAALLFAVHPVHVESVTWVAALKDPLFFSQLLGSLLFYMRYRDDRRPGQYAVFLLLLVGALASKSLALPTVVLMVAAERLIGAPTPWRTIARRVAAPAALTAGALAIILYVGAAAQIVMGPHGGSWGSHWQLMAWAMVRYLAQAFVPAGFRLHYCFFPPGGVGDWRNWVSVLVLGGAAGLGIGLWKRDRRLAFVWLWFFACLLPVANLVPFSALQADRYLYSASLAAVLAVALVMERLPARAAVLGATVALLAAVTASRAWLWQDIGQLWDEVASDPACWADDSPIAQNVLFEWAATRDPPEESVAAFEKVFTHPAEKRRLHDGAACFQFQRSLVGQPLPDGPLEARAAAIAVRVCSSAAAAWERQTLANWLANPPLAAQAAARAFALEGTPVRQWQRGIAEVNAGIAAGPAQMETALRTDAPTVCPLFHRWRQSPRAPREVVEVLAPLCP